MQEESETAVSDAAALVKVLHDELQSVNHTRNKEENSQDQVEPEMQTDSNDEEISNWLELYGKCSWRNGPDVIVGKRCRSTERLINDMGGRAINRVIQRPRRIPGRPAIPYP